MGNAVPKIEKDLREIGSKIATELRRQSGKPERGKAVSGPASGPASGPDRRLHTRFALGLPVGVHLAGREAPMTVELLDVSVTGGRFRCVGEKVRVSETATVAFVSQDQRRCSAEGQVVRADASGEFALRIETSNEAFAEFVTQLAE